MKQQTVTNFPGYLKLLIACILGIPMALSFVFTQKQWYPATYVINLLADDDGKSPFIIAVFLNWLIMLIPVFALVALALVVTCICFFYRHAE